MRFTKYVCLMLIILAGCQPKPKTTRRYWKKLSRDSIENIYLTDILLSKDTDSVKRCAIRDFKAGKYYWYGYGGRDEVRQFFKAYAKKNYGLILISYGDISWTGEEAYNNEMEKLLYGIKMKAFGVIYREAEKEYRKLHPKYQAN